MTTSHTTPTHRRRKTHPGLPPQSLEFPEWMLEVRTLLRKLKWSKKALASLDEDAWREFYFWEGLTPAEAVHEEYQAGL
jgi:hypothetical protein